MCPLDTMKLSCQPVVVDGEELEGVRVAPARREDASQGVEQTWSWSQRTHALRAVVDGIDLSTGVQALLTLRS